MGIEEFGGSAGKQEDRELRGIAELAKIADDKGTSTLVNILADTEEQFMEGDFSSLSEQLIYAPSFEYSEQQMREVGEYLVEKRIPSEKRAAVFELILRRKAMGHISDPVAREKYWSLFSSDHLVSLSLVTGPYGRERVISDLEMMSVFYTQFENFRQELDRNNREIIESVRGIPDSAPDMPEEFMGIFRDSRKRRRATRELSTDAVFSRILDDHSYYISHAVVEKYLRILNAR